MIAQETIDTVFATMDIVEVVKEFVPDLKRTGNAWRALSPFAQEKTPSFHVVPSKQIFKDFSTGKGGNAINFLMEHERYTYPEAIKWLCDFYRINYVVQEKERSEERQEQIAGAQQVLEFVEVKYKNALAGSIAYTELMERGLTDDEILEWGLGYATDGWNYITTPIVERGMTNVALDLGLLRKGKTTFDALRCRITIPVHDHNGIIRGFAGRLLKAFEKDEHGNKVAAGKYVNPDNSFYYDKSKILYGFHKARQAIVKAGKVYAFEGYTDVIAAHRMELVNSVGMCGTALTEHHLRRLKSLMKIPHIVLAADNDAAGVKSTLRNVDLCLAAGFKVEVMDLKAAKDVDEFVREQCLIKTEVENV